MHDKGVYHRDLKMNNWMYLPKENQIKLIDFGMSTLDDLPRIDYAGASSYETPEFLRRLPSKPSKIDSWTLGVSLYFLLYHSKPFGSNLL